MVHQRQENHEVIAISDQSNSIDNDEKLSSRRLGNIRDRRLLLERSQSMSGVYQSLLDQGMDLKAAKYSQHYSGESNKAVRAKALLLLNRQKRQDMNRYKQALGSTKEDIRKLLNELKEDDPKKSTEGCKYYQDYLEKKENERTKKTTATVIDEIACRASSIRNSFSEHTSTTEFSSDTELSESFAEDIVDDVLPPASLCHQAHDKLEHPQRRRDSETTKQQQRRKKKTKDRLSVSAHSSLCHNSDRREDQLQQLVRRDSEIAKQHRRKKKIKDQLSVSAHPTVHYEKKTRDRLSVTTHSSGHNKKKRSNGRRYSITTSHSWVSRTPDYRYVNNDEEGDYNPRKHHNDPCGLSQSCHSRRDSSHSGRGVQPRRDSWIFELH